MNLNRFVRRIRNLAAMGLLSWSVMATAGDYHLVGQVTEVHLADRIVVIDGQEYRLGSPVRFTTDRSGGDMVSDLRPGVFVRFSASPDGREQPITDLRVLSGIPE